MEYLCRKQISIGGRTYCPGETIPDGVVLGSRSGKLEKSGHIAAVHSGAVGKDGSVAGLAETGPGVWNEAVRIPVETAFDGENARITSVNADLSEIQQVFSILQMNAEEGAKEISGVDSENVLILLHASDSRATIKGAARKRADKLGFSEGGDG